MATAGAVAADRPEEEDMNSTFPCTAMQSSPPHETETKHFFKSTRRRVKETRGGELPVWLPSGRTIFWHGPKPVEARSSPSFDGVDDVDDLALID